MTSLTQSINEQEQDLELVSLKSISHAARGAVFELYVCRLADSGQLRVYIARNGEICGYIFDPAHDVHCQSVSASETAIVEDLVATAIGDIEANLYGLY